MMKEGCQIWKVPAMSMAFCEFPIHFMRINDVAVVEQLQRAVFSGRLQLYETQGGHFWWGKHTMSYRQLYDADFKTLSSFPAHVVRLAHDSKANYLDASNWTLFSSAAQGVDFVNYRVDQQNIYGQAHGETLTYKALENADHCLRDQEDSFGPNKEYG